MKRTMYPQRLPDAINCSPKSNFTQIRNSVLRDPKLTLKAKGLIALLLSNSSKWTSYMKQIEQICSEGRDAIRSAVQELEANDYLLRVNYVDKLFKMRRGSFWAYTDIPGQFVLDEHLNWLNINGLEAQGNQTKLDNYITNKTLAVTNDEVVTVTEEPRYPLWDYPILGYPYMDYPYMGNPQLKRLIDININLKEENTLDNFSWKDLSSKFGTEHVRFVKWFLQTQQTTYPNRIKGKITANHERVISSLRTLEKLMRIDNYDFETDIKPVLQQVTKDQFWASNMLSLGSLRTKSKNGEIKFVNILNTMKMPGIVDKTTPEDIMYKHFNGRGKLWDQGCLQPALDILTDINRKDEVQVANGICEINDWFIDKQKRPDLKKLDSDIHSSDHQIYSKWVNIIPNAHQLIKMYVQWIGKQDWLNSIGPNHFQSDSKLFKRFLNQYQKELGYDFFNGRGL
jgi:hypothetical protein